MRPQQFAEEDEAPRHRDERITAASMRPQQFAEEDWAAPEELALSKLLQ